MPAFSVNAYAAISPALVPPVTVTLAFALVVWNPTASRARAASVCRPLVAVLLSHEIAREIEAELDYPGQIKVTVIRESRAVDVARNASTHHQEPGSMHAA